jgi:hypothetical protein
LIISAPGATDNGAWESEAMKNIKAFMEVEVPGLHVIA